ncbi:MAG: lamin tail domain-containing protein, partial [Candidatus Syntrophosphaera sp.]
MTEAWHSLWRIWPILCLTLLPFSAVSSGVVINEVCYDPVGADAGHEWIELYNAGDAEVNLEGALLLSGGSSYSI